MQTFFGCSVQFGNIANFAVHFSTFVMHSIVYDEYPADVRMNKLLECYVIEPYNSCLCKDPE